jgi:hypothetical protein
MKGPSVALLVFMISLVGCAGPGELLFKNAIVVDHLEGNYQVLARCTYEHLARQQAQLSMSDLREQETVRIAFTKAPQTYWELSFVNEDGGRQTRLEVRSGSFPSEHTLALARACAALERLNSSRSSPRPFASPDDRFPPQNGSYSAINSSLFPKLSLT